MRGKIQKSKIKSQNLKEKSEKKKISTDVIIVCVLVLFLIPSIVGLLHSGFPSTDDGGWMVIRFSAFYEAIRHGQFPVRFLLRLNNGYGYPVADFLYPLFMYLGVPIHLLGINFMNTIKVILGVSMICSGIFSYLWFRKLFAVLPSGIGALAYVLFPYHLFDTYQRGSVGEVLALSIVPFIFWQIEKKNFVFTAIGIALLILSHNTLALLFLPIIIGYMLIKKNHLSLRGNMTKQSHGWLNFNGIASAYGFAMTTVFFGLGLSAFFWLPALYDKQFTVFDSTSVSDYSQYFLQTKNFGLLGIFALMIAFISFNFVFRKAQKHDIFFLGVLYVGLFFSLPISSFLWKLLPLPQLVQFPFRFLSIVILGVSFMTAFMFSRMKSSLRIFIAILSLFLMYAVSWNYLLPKNYQDYPDSYYATNQDSTTVQNEYMPKWVTEIPSSAPNEKAEIIDGVGTIGNVISNGSNKIMFTAQITKPSLVAINTIYFPGWRVFANNKEKPIAYTNFNGFIQFSLPPGNYSIIAKFGETRLRAISDMLSLISLLVVIGFLINPLRKFLISNLKFPMKL